MSLETALNNLNDDNISNISPEDIDLNKTISIEEISLSSNKYDCCSMNIKDVNKKVIDKFNQLYNQYVFKKNIETMDKIDKKVAMEIFTMLPESDNIEIAKLTNAPSAINKEIIENNLSNIEDTIPEDVIESLNILYGTLSTKFDSLCEIRDNLDTHFKEIKDKVCKLAKTGAYVITEDKKRVDLLRDSLSEITLINDKVLDYKKYENNLVNRYREILNDVTITNFYKLFNSNDEVMIDFIKSSLNELVDKIHLISNKLKDDVTYVTDYITRYTMFKESNNRQLNEYNYLIINDSKTVVEIVNTIEVLEEFIAKDKGIYKIKELVDFLD